MIRNPFGAAPSTSTPTDTPIGPDQGGGFSAPPYLQVNPSNPLTPSQSGDIPSEPVVHNPPASPLQGTPQPAPAPPAPAPEAPPPSNGNTPFPILPAPAPAPVIPPPVAAPAPVAPAPTEPSRYQPLFTPPEAPAPVQPALPAPVAAPAPATPVPPAPIVAPAPRAPDPVPTLIPSFTPYVAPETPYMPPDPAGPTIAPYMPPASDPVPAPTEPSRYAPLFTPPDVVPQQPETSIPIAPQAPTPVQTPSAPLTPTDTPTDPGSATNLIPSFTPYVEPAPVSNPEPVSPAPTEPSRYAPLFTPPATDPVPIAPAPIFPSPSPVDSSPGTLIPSFTPYVDPTSADNPANPVPVGHQPGYPDSFPIADPALPGSPIPGGSMPFPTTRTNPISAPDKPLDGGTPWVPGLPSTDPGGVGIPAPGGTNPPTQDVPMGDLPGTTPTTSPATTPAKPDVDWDQLGKIIMATLQSPSVYDDPTFQSAIASEKSSLQNQLDSDSAATDADFAARGLYLGSNLPVATDALRTKRDKTLGDYTTNLTMDRAHTMANDRQQAFGNVFNFLNADFAQQGINLDWSRLASVIGNAGAPTEQTPGVPTTGAGGIDPSVWAMISAFLTNTNHTTTPVTTGQPTFPNN